MAYSPSQAQRAAMRSALSAHPNRKTVLQGRAVSSLPLDELAKALRDLGLDPVAIASNWGAPPVLPAVAAPPCDNPPQDSEQDTAMNAQDMLDGKLPLTSEFPWPDAQPDAQDETAAIESEMQRLRSLVATSGFGLFEDELRALVVAARKPPVTVERIVERTVEAVRGGPVHSAKPTGRTATWKDLFAVRGVMGARTCQVWDGTHPHTPQVDPEYLFPQPQTAIALCQIARHRNVFMFGHKGTGKTEFAVQLAARTGRPLAIISCDDGTDAATLVGVTIPSGDSVGWQDGILTKAIRTPGCVVLIDEPAAARPGALLVLQNVLANRVLYIAETGERVPCAPGVLFLGADNTNGTGGGARRGYHGTHALNAAFMDRYGAIIRFDYLPEAKEAGVLVARTGCTAELAALLVKGAQVTRAAASNEGLSQGVGLRQLVAWAELLTDGVEPEAAFCAAVLDRAPEQDQETLREQLLLTYDSQTVRAALNPQPVVEIPIPGATTVDPTLTNPTPAGRRAAQEFAENSSPLPPTHHTHRNR